MTVILTASSREAGGQVVDYAADQGCLSPTGRTRGSCPLSAPPASGSTDDMDAAVAADGLAVIPPLLGWVGAPVAGTSTPPV